MMILRSTPPSPFGRKVKLAVSMLGLSGEIKVEPVDIEGKSTLGSLERASISNSTQPPSMMVYLPILSEGEKLYFSCNSYGNKISVEVFEGYIPINTDTEWWLKHAMIARSPQLPVLGSANSDLTWQAKESGLYTLVIVLWDRYNPETKLDFQISVGGSQ